MSGAVRRQTLPDRVHIVGASGSGTTSLAAAMSATHGHRHLDTDDYFWLRTSPPYREKRPREARLALLRAALSESPRWVLSGSLCGWGDALIPEFELVVFLVVPTPTRLRRLQEREVERHGRQALAPGGALRESHVEFLGCPAQVQLDGRFAQVKVVADLRVGEALGSEGEHCDFPL